MDRNMPLYDTTLTDLERAKWLLSQLTPEEKCACFTQPIGMAASFDRELIRRAGDVTGKESRAFENAVGKAGHLRLAPTVDLCRDPRWGRTE